MHLPTSLAITLSLLTKRQAFEVYDSCATTCFDESLEIFASQCTETLGSKGYIACLCGDTDFDISSANCILTQCGATILNQTASQHDYNCNLNGSPPALNAQQFIAAGHSDSDNSGDTSYSSILNSYLSSVTAATTHALPTANSPAPTTGGGSNAQTTSKIAAQESATETSSQPATSSTSSSSSSGSNTLSTGSLVGSIVGSITGAIASFTTVYFGWKTYKMKKADKKEKAAAEAQAHAAGD